MRVLACAIGLSLCFAVLVRPAQVSDPASVQREAHQARQEQDWAKAAQLYRRLTELTPGAMGAWGNLGNALKHLGRYKEAAKALGRAQQLGPHSLAVRLDLALVYIAADQYREAIPPLEAGLRMDPGNARLLQLLGLCQLNSGQYRSAVQSLKLARKGQAKPSLSLLYTLAEAETLSGQQAAAMQILREMLRDNQNEPALHLLLGEALLYQGQSEQAETELRRAHELDPKMADAELWLGLAAQKQPHYSAAQSHFRAAVKLQPDCIKCLYELGATEYLMQDLIAAERDLKHCIALAGAELKPGEPHARTVAGAWYYLGRLEMSHHHVRQAADDLQIASRLNPAAPAPHYQLGRAWKLLGQHAAAQKQFQIFQKLRERHQQHLDKLFRESFQQALKSASHHANQ
jgi:tetratricopeptide (TPR) repeat protein